MPKIKIRANDSGKEQEFDITPGTPDAQKIQELAQSGRISILSYTKEPTIRQEDLAKPYSPNPINTEIERQKNDPFLLSNVSPQAKEAATDIGKRSIGGLAGYAGAGPFGAAMGAMFPPQNLTQAASMAIMPRASSKVAQAISALKSLQGPVKQALMQALTQGVLGGTADITEKALQGQKQDLGESLIRGGLMGSMAGATSGVQSMYQNSPAVKQAKLVGKLDRTGGVNPRGKTPVEPWTLDEKLSELPGAKRITPPTQGPTNIDEGRLTTNYELWKQSLKADNASEVFDKILQKDPHEISAFIDSFDTNSDAVRKGLIEHLYQPGKDFGAFGKIKEIYRGNKEVLQQKLQAVYGSSKQASRAADTIDALGNIPQARTHLDRFVDYAKHRATYGLIVAPIALASGGGKVSTLLLAEGGTLLAIETPKLINAAAKSPTFGKMFKDWVDAGMPQSSVKYGTPLYQALQHISSKQDQEQEQQ